MDDDIALVMAEAMLADGANHTQIARATGMEASDIADLGVPEGVKTGQKIRWADSELAFLHASVGRLSDVEIAASIGRTVHAVKIRRTLMGLSAPTKWPGTFSLSQVARILGTSVNAVSKWVERDVLRARQAPVVGLKILLVSLHDLKRFVVNPYNWVYFKPERVTDPRLAGLIRLARQRWNDEWLTSGQVAEMHGLTAASAVNRAIRKGCLPAVRWGKWHIRRSDAEQAHFFLSARDQLHPLDGPTMQTLF